MRKILIFIIISTALLLGVFVLYSHPKYIPFLICAAVSILLFEWIYCILFEKKKSRWNLFMQQLEANCNNMDWLSKEKKEVEFLLSADWFQRKSRRNKLYLIEDKINKIEQDYEQVIESLKNANSELKNKISELSKENCELQNESHKLKKEVQELKNDQNNTEKSSRLTKGEQFSKIDYIRIINTLHKFGFYKESKIDVMQEMGMLIDVDLSGYSNDLSQGFSKTTIEKQTSIFLRMKEAYEEEYNERLKKQTK